MYAPPTNRQKYMSVVIITGASRGIGASTAVQSAKRGFGVIVTYNSHAAGAKET